MHNRVNRDVSIVSSEIGLCGHPTAIGVLRHGRQLGVGHGRSEDPTRPLLLIK
jgi:hypothetical protein